MATTFSIITVCYNAAKCIEPTIASLSAQTWPSIDFVVVDGNSKDGTQAIVRRHAERVSTFVSEPDQGIFDAMNKGTRLAKGDVLLCELMPLNHFVLFIQHFNNYCHNTASLNLRLNACAVCCVTPDKVKWLIKPCLS